MEDHQTAWFRVTGMVQGVGFRWWTQRQAQRLDLRGSVRNLNDGSVEVAVGGTAENVQKLAELLRRGPSGARVSSVDSLPERQTDLPYPFEIGRGRSE